MRRNIPGWSVPNLFWMASLVSEAPYRVSGMLKVENWNERVWFWLVSGIAVLARLGLWAVYPLTPNNDSPTYVQLAKNILTKGFSTYNATRTPGYPAFLALTGDWAYFAQLLLGLLTTWLFFYLGWKLSGRAWFGALAALIHTLNFGQLFFEATLLTETLTTFLVTAAFAGAIALATEKPAFFRFTLYAFLAGLAAALAGMVRPLFAFLPFLLSSFYFLLSNLPLQKRIICFLTAILPALVIFGWWLNFVDTNYKILSFDTIGGFRWLNHTGEYFELVPDEYAVIRDTYLKYRDAKIAETGSQTNAVWDAMDELQKNSRMGFYALSRELTTISLNLIRAHPDLYLRNVLSGWWMFWWAAVYWSPDVFSLPALVPVLRGLIFVERGVMIFANLAFLAVSMVVLLRKKARIVLGKSPFVWLALASIWAASAVQTLLDHGDNPRYLVPLQTLVIVLVAYWSLQIYSVWKTKRQ
jgi:4-amino-4-deoxy-L-arabinose transferase-like glycosyltransferase